MNEIMSKQSYHHGDLREALLKAALGRLEEERASEISLRKLAGQLGVDHTAVYRHFKNRDALLAAMIEVGYRELNGAMEWAWQDRRALARARQARGQSVRRVCKGAPQPLRDHVWWRSERVGLSCLATVVRRGYNDVCHLYQAGPSGRGIYG